MRICFVRGEGVREHEDREGGAGRGDEGGGKVEVAWIWGEGVAAAWRRQSQCGEEREGRGGGGGGGPWNHSRTFSAEGLPIQYALVPSARVMFSGLKPDFFA